MNQNKTILFEWGKNIENLPKTDFNSAKNLYLDYLKENDINKKRKIREQIIIGALYVVYNHLSRNNFDTLISGFYDMNDIISSTVEYLIYVIDNGELLNYDRFSCIFNTNTYYSFLTNELIEQKYPIGEETILTTDNFSKILNEIILVINKKGELLYDEFIKLFISKGYMNIKDIWLYCGNDISKTYILFMTIIRIINENNVTLSETKIDQFKYLLINSALELLSKEKTDRSEYTEDKIIDEMYYEGILDIVFNDKELSDNDIIAQRYGLVNYDNPHSLEEVAISKKSTRERIRQKEAKMLRQLRRNKDLLNYVRGEM